MKLLIVADGPRDKASLPPLLRTILQREISIEFEPWNRLNKKGSGRGYGRKLAYSMAQARSRGMDGLVAVVDQDKDRSNTHGRDLKAARDVERSKASAFPTALGVAVPHVDVWLLDDAVAVRTALSLQPNAAVINIRHTQDPKAELDQLCSAAGKQWSESLPTIAEHIDPKRCAHSKETGFLDFVEDCTRELATVVTS